MTGKCLNFAIGNFIMRKRLRRPASYIVSKKAAAHSTLNAVIYHITDCTH